MIFVQGTDTFRNIRCNKYRVIHLISQGFYYFDVNNFNEREKQLKPIVLAMIIADHYYRDSQSGKSIISGTFNSINSASFPTKHSNCAIYISLTDLATEGELQLLFRREDGEFEMKLPSWHIQCPDDRRSVVEIGGNINGLPIPDEGDYEFVVLWNSMEIFSRRIKASKLEMKESDE